MHILFYGGSVIPILPESSFPFLSLVVFLSRPASVGSVGSGSGQDKVLIIQR